MCCGSRRSRLGPPRRAERASAAAADRQARLERNPAYQQLVGEKELSDPDRDPSGRPGDPAADPYPGARRAAPMVSGSCRPSSATTRSSSSNTPTSRPNSALPRSPRCRARSNGERLGARARDVAPPNRSEAVPTSCSARSLAGLCLGAALTLGREYLDTSVHDERDIRDGLDLPVLGSIKHIPA